MLLLLLKNSCAIQDCLAAFWPLPSRCQQQTLLLFLVVTIKHVCRHCQRSPGRQNHSQLRITDIKYVLKIQQKPSGTKKQYIMSKCFSPRNARLIQYSVTNNSCTTNNTNISVAVEKYLTNFSIFIIKKKKKTLSKLGIEVTSST